MNETWRQVGNLAPSEITRRLQREGIACVSEGVLLEDRQEFRIENQNDAERYVRYFDVKVYDLEAMDVQRKFPSRKGAGFGRKRVEPDDRLRRIVARAAVRAVYVLGLDDGQVVVATDARGKPAIMQLSSGAKQQDRAGYWHALDARALRESLLKAESELGVQAMLGADPEFVLQSWDGRVMPASRYLPPGGLAGCDSIVRRGIRVWPLVELRPDPAHEPAAIVASLRRLLLLAARRINSNSGGADAASLRWRAGALPVPGLPLGGHVHISGATLTSERLRALDNAVALPLRLLEPAGAAPRRPRYGALGDFRRQPHGGFEYRTPPSWLVSPRLALGVLSLAKIAVEHAGEFAGRRPLDDDAMRDVFYAGGEGAIEGDGEDALREAAMIFYTDLRKLSSYRHYAADIDFIFDAINAHRHWDETADLRPKWGIPLKAK